MATTGRSATASATATAAGGRRRTRRVQRSSHLTLRGRVLLILGLGFLIAAYPIGRIELVYLGSLLAVMPLVALTFLRFRKQRMSVSRRFAPSVAEAGRTVSVTMEIRNLAAAQTGVASWRDNWPWAPYATAGARLRSLARYSGALGKGNFTTIDYVLDPPRRGVFDIGPLVVEFGDPFGLARGELTVGDHQKLVVAPSLVMLPLTGQSIAADDGSARALQRRAIGGEDDLMTREYRFGDPLRRVHWRASAHHGELMVRQEEQRSHAQARILLDTQRAGYRDAGATTAEEPESASFEWALAFAASLALHLQRVGFTVQLIETADRQLTPPEHSDEFLESLATTVLVDRPARPQSDSESYSAAAAPFALATMASDPGRSLGSLFAVVADAGPYTLERLISQRSQFDLAIAFIVNPHNESVITPLDDAGWICIAVRPTDDLSAVWLAAAEAREANLASR